MDASKKFSILWFGQRWDKYRRRDVELISRLIKYPDIENIILIEPPLPITSIANFWRRKYDEDGKETWARVLHHGFIWQPEDGIWVASPLVPIIGTKHKFSFFYNISRKLLAKWILRKFNVQNLVLWIGSPYFTSGLIGCFNEKLICYSLCEDFSEQDPENKEMILKEDRKLSAKSDLIFVVSKELARQHEEYGKKVHIVPNAVDVDFITSIKNKSFLPEDLKNIPNPIVGFVGGLNENIDLDLIIYLANRKPKWSIVMVGPLSHYVQNVVKRYSFKNVYFLGSRPFKDAVAYIDNFNVCILPYKNNDRNRRVSFMKMYIYLALGKPVVASFIGKSYLDSDVITVVDNKHSFSEALEAEISQDSTIKKQRRIEEAKMQSWDKRVEEIYSIMISKVSGKGK